MPLELSAGVVAGLAEGSILFVKNGLVSEDNANFQYDDANDRVLLGAGVVIRFGGDVDLQRALANVLKTPNVFRAGLNITAQDGAAPQVILGERGPANEAGITFGSASDLVVFRGAADRLDLASGDSLRLAGGHVQLVEIAAPGNPPANEARCYVRDNGMSSPLNRTQLVVHWSDGTITLIAESPAA